VRLRFLPKVVPPEVNPNMQFFMMALWALFSCRGNLGSADLWPKNSKDGRELKKVSKGNIEGTMFGILWDDC